MIPQMCIISQDFLEKTHFQRKHGYSKKPVSMELHLGKLGLGQCFSKAGFGISSSSIRREIVRNVNSVPYLTHSESETGWLEPRTLCFNRPSRCF